MSDIKLVIKIDEDLYEMCRDSLGDEDNIEGIIANGTPLPKSHGRIGDLDDLRKEISSWGMNDYEPSDFIDAIDRADTIIKADNTCSTCTHSDETDGSHCYECVKGKNKHEADKESRNADNN